MTVSAQYPLFSNATPADGSEPDKADCKPQQIVKITNHVGIGLARLIEQYKEKPRMENFLKSFLQEVQAVEDALFEIIDADLDNSTGDALRLWGKIVGQPDNLGLDDDNYRVIIKARIRVNRSDAHPNDVIDVMLIIATTDAFESPPVIKYYMGSAGNTGHSLQLLSDIGTIDPDVVFDLLDQSDAAGVPLQFIFGFSPAIELFRWESTTGSVSHPGQGFSSTVTPSTGGKLASVRG